MPKRFAIAVSFPGEHRQFVLKVVKQLSEHLGRDRVFYDEWYEAELVGLDGDLKLKRYYREQCEMVVPFFSEHFRKPWCKIEWGAIRAMLLERRDEDAVVPVELDGTRIEGWEPVDFAIRRGSRTAAQIAEQILAAYRHRHCLPASTPTPALRHIVPPQQGQDADTLRRVSLIVLATEDPRLLDLSARDLRHLLDKEKFAPDDRAEIDRRIDKIRGHPQVKLLLRQRHELVSLYQHVLSKTLRTARGAHQGLSDSQVNIIETLFGSTDPAYHDFFTTTSFNEPVWQALIKDPQVIGKSSKNHLHFSNSLIAEELYADMERRRLAGEFAGRSRPICLLETGTGGCNTTYVVLNRLLNEHWTTGSAEDEDISFQYLGFDINPFFADQGNALFQGDSAWVAPGERDARTRLSDPRLRPWPGRTRFVERGNAREEIPRLLSTDTEGTVDYYFTSYMLHHVPNGDSLVKYLCGPPQGIHTAVGDPRREMEYFSRRLRRYLVAPPGSKSPLEVFDSARDPHVSAAEYCAYVLAEYLRGGHAITTWREREYVVSCLERSMRAGAAAATSAEFALGEDWVRGYFFDPQRAMLRRIYNLLSCNGLLVIADPDGKSGFNRAKMARKDMKAVELAVAHFRTLTRILEVLTQERFQIVHYGKVVKTRGGQFDFIAHDVPCTDFEIEDNNMGYFVSARKVKASR